MSNFLKLETDEPDCIRVEGSFELAPIVMDLGHVHVTGVATKGQSIVLEFYAYHNTVQGNLYHEVDGHHYKLGPSFTVDAKTFSEITGFQVPQPLPPPEPASELYECDNCGAVADPEDLSMPRICRCALHPAGFTPTKSAPSVAA